MRQINCLYNNDFCLSNAVTNNTDKEQLLQMSIPKRFQGSDM